MESGLSAQTSSQPIQSVPSNSRRAGLRILADDYSPARRTVRDRALIARPGGRHMIADLVGSGRVRRHSHHRA
jgi:hypothetical protein